MSVRPLKSLIYGLNVLLRDMPVSGIFDKQKDGISQKNFSTTLFTRPIFSGAFLRRYPQYSENEVSNIYSMLKKLTDNTSSGDIGLFSLIVHFSNQCLFTEGEWLRCRHSEIIMWREALHGIGQQPFLCAFLAKNDLYPHYERKNFDFSPYVKTDNVRLRHILSSGYSENHFHLKGSSPAFHFSWICLMNNIVNRKTDFLSNKMKQTFFSNAEADKNLTLHDMVIRAAVIRCFLWQKLNFPEANPKCFEKFDPQKGWDTNNFYFFPSDIQAYINMLKLGFGHSLDYITDTKSYRGTYSDFSGENMFQYKAFQAIYKGDESFLQYIDLFYAYLLIYVRFREEIIQCNDVVGFHNFSLYQGRKSMFLNPGKYRKYYDAFIKMPLVEAAGNDALRSLEARVMSDKTADNFKRKIKHVLNLKFTHDMCRNCRCFQKKLDCCIRTLPFNYTSKACCACPDFDTNEDACTHINDKICIQYFNKIFFTPHISKKVDSALISGYKNHPINGVLQCRHYKHRKEIVSVGINTIIKTRNQGGFVGSLIYGIDACSQEIGCRPEVFAPSYRKARQAPIPHSNILSKACQVPFLRISYHAGEDFLDVTDGLRAIDEAVTFLEMKNSDRIGHALALGINAADWYAFKGNTIFLPRHDYLDNVVWLYMKMREYSIVDYELSYKLQEEFREQFEKIYLENLPYPLKDKNITIETYYAAWKLRGDEPQLYVTYSDDLKFDRTIKSCEPWKLQTADLRRDNKIVRSLYYHYHYTPAIKLKGNEQIEKTVTYDYIKAVEAVQKVMQYDLSYRGIGIECNPSSNYLIGTFKDYSKHPIFAFYNLGLDENDSCAQLQVSINTDDQGVFDTNLENEYAIMACALENALDENGNKRYKPSNIYQWIDNVRKMSLEQSFKLIDNSLGRMN